MKKSKSKLTLLLAALLLISLTACKTVLVVPVIQEPVLKDRPTHLTWDFVPVDPDDENTDFLLSTPHLRILTQYLIDLNAWGEDNRDWVNYYIDELNTIEEKFN